MADTAGNPWTARTPFADPRIGAFFAAQREARGWSGAQVAAELKWSPSKVCRIEGARTSVTARNLDLLIALYGVGEPAATTLRGLLTAGAARRFAASKAVVSGDDETDLLAGGDLAAVVREWAPQYVPRLLQTPAYAQAIANSRQQVIPTSPATARAQAAAAARWQARLTGDAPCQLRAVLDESVLYRAVGGKHLMAAQLEHLAAPGGGDVEVRVLPFTCYAPSAPGAFTHLSYPELPGLTACPDLVLLENLDGLYRPDLSENEVWKRALMFGSLWELAEPAGGPVARALAAP
jgi:transcriptional regulator with XRE-family HTH domain